MNASKEKKEQLIDYIRSHFSRRECCNFVPSKTKKLRPLAASKGGGPVDKAPCMCGAPEDEHLKR